MPKVGQEKGTPARRAEFVRKLREMGEGQWCVYWPWSDNRDGYTYIHVDGDKVRAHRWVYEQVYGALPKQGRGATGPVVMHICDNRACVRLSHLRLGTQEDNIRDAVAKGRMPGRTTGDFSHNRYNQKLSDEDVVRIRELRGKEVTQHAIALVFGVSDATISQILHGKRRPKLI